MVLEPTVDLAFPITPGVVPIDHGYALYSALARVVPELHGADWLSVHPLTGKATGTDSLKLNRGTQLILRVPVERIPTALRLSGRSIQFDSHGFTLGTPVIRALEPSPTLFTWRVAIRLTNPPKNADGRLNLTAFRDVFKAEAERQLSANAINGRLQVLDKKDLHIKNQRIVAFSVQVDGLNPEASLVLQTIGLGGKRRMGCGVFRPVRVTHPQAD